MDIFLARQPIFNTGNEVVAYEILYRNSEENSFGGEDAEFATGSALTHAFVDFGISNLTNKKRAFINFTDGFLKNGVATIFPSDYLAVEVLETVHVDEEIVECCRKLHHMGYLIALDDFTYSPVYDELIRTADVLKIDFRATPPDEQASLVKRLARPGLTFLAEKVETPEEYRRAAEIGYSLFQGYYFAKPEVKRQKKVHPCSRNRLRLIRILNEKHPDFEEVIRLIESDLSFSYQVLRIVNSAYYGRLNRIASVRQAVVYLGLDEVRKWLYIAVISDMKQDSPQEIIHVCMLRSKLLETLALENGRTELAPQLLTVGMFSMVDVLLNMPMEEAVREMNFSENISCVLIGRDQGFMGACFEIAHLYDLGSWSRAFALAAENGIPAEKLNQAYLKAIRWADGLKF